MNLKYVLPIQRMFTYKAFWRDSTVASIFSCALTMTTLLSTASVA